MPSEYSKIFNEDLAAHDPPLQDWSFLNRVKYPVLAWQKRLRMLEDLDRRKGSLSPLGKLLFVFLKWRHFQDSVRLGFTIPLHSFGPGLSIAHWGTITVAYKARVGRNCRIHQGVTIGSSKDQVPTIGDDCFIGANASIIGGVTLGNNVKVGANAMVNRSFGDNAVLVGVPAIDIRIRSETGSSAERISAGPGE